MTDMTRMTVSFPDDIDARILELRKTERFSRSSYSSLVRYLVELGLKAEERRRTRPG